ncbi:hypothetical protein MIMGU_mgv11b021666mg, partial [Erythranthe guttata]
ILAQQYRRNMSQLSVHFKTSIIPSRTKHESFDLFGSHAQLLRTFFGNGSVRCKRCFTRVVKLLHSWHCMGN